MIDTYVSAVIVKKDDYEWLCEIKDAFIFILEKFNFKILVVDKNIIYLNVEDKIQIPISMEDYLKLINFIKEEKVKYIKDVRKE